MNRKKLKSLDHGKTATGELVLEQPVAQVDGQVDAVHTINREHAAVVLHVHGYELVADLGRVLGRVGLAELSRLHFVLDFWVLGQVDLV